MTRDQESYLRYLMKSSDLTDRDLDERASEITGSQGAGWQYLSEWEASMVISSLKEERGD